MELSSHEQQLKRMLNDPDILLAQREVLKRYDQEAEKNEGLALKTRLSRAYIIVQLARNIKKPFKSMVRKDIEKHIYGLDLAPASLDLHKISIRHFFKWLYETEEYPEAVKWIKLQNNKKRKLPEDILTPQEIKNMIDVADNLRDKALVSVLYDSGCRLGEILGIKQKDVTMDQYGARIAVHGKTGDRPVRLILSIPDLTLLINNHPDKGPDKPLFYNDKNPGQPLGARRVQVIVDVLARRAGLNKHVYPHLLRHSRATHLAADFTESQLKVILGWTRDSRMPGTYVSLSGGEVDKKILEMAGLLDKEEAKKEADILKPRNCPRCKETNPATARFCYKCGAALDLQTAMSTEGKDGGLMMEFMDLLKREPRLLDMMKGIPLTVENKDPK
ncbi:MAG: site-specific integrase [Methanobacteriota archaeon]